MPHQDLGVVSKPDGVRNEPVPAEGVLPRLFQIEHSADVRLLKLLDNVELLNLAVGQARRSDQAVCDQVTVQPEDEWLGTAVPVLHATVASPAQGAEEVAPVLEIRSDDHPTLPAAVCRLWKDFLRLRGGKTLDGLLIRELNRVDAARGAVTLLGLNHFVLLLRVDLALFLEAPEHCFLN